jgi:hypothetical protein
MNKRKLSKVIRANADVPGTPYPIVIKQGNNPPVLEGAGFYWSNRSGDIIRHPTAYKKKGWSSLRYNHSTHRIEVGEEWLITMGLVQHKEDLNGIG